MHTTCLKHDNLCIVLLLQHRQLCNYLRFIPDPEPDPEPDLKPELNPDSV